MTGLLNQRTSHSRYNLRSRFEDFMTKLFDGVSFWQNFDFNPFVSNAYFPYLLQTSENQGVEKGCIGKKLG